MSKSATAERLLDVAEGLVRQRGFNAFSYRDLADAVGIRTASIHYHYATKHDLALHVIARFTDRLLDALHDFDTHRKDPLARIDGYISLYRATGADGRSICVCTSMASDLETLPEEVRGAIEVYYRHSREWLEDTVRAGIESGRFRPGVSVEAVATFMLAALQGCLIEARIVGNLDPLRDVGQSIHALLGV